MKKLMIAAAAAAMVGGAYAEDCIGCGAGKVIVVQPVSPTYIGEEVQECVAGHVWDLSIKAKTLANKCAKCTVCDDCDETEKAMYYDNKSRTFTGVAWTCYCPCVEDDDYAGDDWQEKTNMLFWDAKNKVGFGYIDFTYTAIPTPAGGDPTYTYYTADWAIDTTVDASQYFDEAFRYGKKADKAAWGFSYEGTGNNRAESARDQILIAEGIGLGTIKQFKATKKDAAYLVINKIQGSCIGSVTACPCPDDDPTGQIIPVCYDFESWCEDGDEVTEVPFYGTFTAKYNASKSKTLRTTPAYLQKLFPSYCVKIDGEVQ